VRPGENGVFRVLCCIVVLICPFAASAQDDEDRQRVCPLLTEPLLRIVLPEVTGHSRCDVRCSGCGCQGGPGYRDQQGKCVGYANLLQKCGPSPHRGCRAECAPVVSGCDLGRVWLKALLARAGQDVTFTAAEPNLPPAQQPPFQRANQTRDGEAEH
jgi:hypothetical protein